LSRVFIHYHLTFFLGHELDGLFYLSGLTQGSNFGWTLRVIHFLDRNHTAVVNHPGSVLNGLLIPLIFKCVISTDDFLGIGLDDKSLVLGFKLDIHPLFLGEQFFHGQLMAAHVLDPTDNLEFLLDHAIRRMRELIPIRMAARAACKNALQTQPDAAEEADWDSFENDLGAVSVHLFARLAPNFIAITDEEQVVAHVVEHDLVLKQDDYDGEEAPQSARQTTQVTQ